MIVLTPTCLPTSIKNGQLYVLPSVIATLMAKHYGKGMASAFPRMIAQVAEPQPR